MAGSRPCLLLSADFTFAFPHDALGLARKLALALLALAASIPLETQAGVSVSSETPRAGMGASSMSEAQTGSLLVKYFKEFVRTRDVDEFRGARYNKHEDEQNPSHKAYYIHDFPRGRTVTAPSAYRAVRTTSIRRSGTPPGQHTVR